MKMPCGVGGEEIGLLEKLLVSVDAWPFDALYRVAIGFVTLPLMSRVWNNDRSGFALISFLLGIFLMLRVVPAVVRRVVPFSDATRRVWTRRRHLAKRYDSYQWQKVFWIGAGLASYIALSGDVTADRIVVSATCMLGGAVGLARWRAKTARAEANELFESRARPLARPIADD
jgi:hypothetical protein